MAIHRRVARLDLQSVSQIAKFGLVVTPRATRVGHSSECRNVPRVDFEDFGAELKNFVPVFPSHCLLEIALSAELQHGAALIVVVLAVEVFEECV